jgi:serine/threonine-protein phosphatase 2A activator
MRFGNKAFRTWLERLATNCDEMIFKFCPIDGFKKAIPELKTYLMESFGSYERIDYGTGHELNFIVFLLCLFKL